MKKLNKLFFSLIFWLMLLSAAHAEKRIAVLPFEVPDSLTRDETIWHW